jgi:MFS family permease
MRAVAVLAAGTMALLGLAAGIAGPDSPVVTSAAVLLLVVASAVTVADNGLAFTAVAERAGPFWSGRALGLQNTAQYLTAAVAAPVAGVVIEQVGYAATFALAGLFPILAIPLVPTGDEHPLS